MSLHHPILLRCEPDVACEMRAGEGDRLHTCPSRGGENALELQSRKATAWLKFGTNARASAAISHLLVRFHADVAAQSTTNTSESVDRRSSSQHHHQHHHHHYTFLVPRPHPPYATLGQDEHLPSSRRPFSSRLHFHSPTQDPTIKILSWYLLQNTTPLRCRLYHPLSRSLP